MSASDLSQDALRSQETLVGEGRENLVKTCASKDIKIIYGKKFNLLAVICRISVIASSTILQQIMFDN